jgi:hypothetical protein
LAAATAGVDEVVDAPPNDEGALDCVEAPPNVDGLDGADEADEPKEEAGLGALKLVPDDGVVALAAAAAGFDAAADGVENLGALTGAA